MSIDFKKFSYDFTESPNFPTEYDDPNYLTKVRSVWAWCKEHNEKISRFVVSLNDFSIKLNSAMSSVSSDVQYSATQRQKAELSATLSERFWNKIKGYSIPTNATYSAKEIDNLHYANLNLIARNTYMQELLKDVLAKK